MSNKKDLQALAETLVEEFYETQGAGVLKNLNKRTYGNLINGREDVLNSMKESLSDYTDEEGKEIGEKEKEEILHLVDREIWGYGIIDDLIHDKSISDIKIHNAENIRIKRNGKREGSDITFPSEGAYKSFVTRLLERNKVNLGTANAIQTFTDADQEDFILRLAVIGGLLIVGGSPLVVIRKIPKNKYSLSELSDLGMFGKTGRKGSLKVHFQERFFPEGNEDLDSLFSQMIESRGILFTGKGASGKTTLMNACIEKIPDSDSVMICQENAELFDLHHPDIIAAHVMVNGGDSKVSYNLGYMNTPVHNDGMEEFDVPYMDSEYEESEKNETKELLRVFFDNLRSAQKYIFLQRCQSKEEGATVKQMAKNERLIALCLLDEVSKRNITVGNLSIIRPKGKTDAPQIEEVFENVQYVKLEFIDYMYRDAKKRLIGYIRDHGLRQQDLEGCLGDLLDEEWYKINI